MRKMRAMLITQREDKLGWTISKYITCEVTGEMNTGEKVWTDVESGEQYFCTRYHGKYIFYKE